MDSQMAVSMDGYGSTIDFIESEKKSQCNFMGDLTVTG